MRTLFPRPFSLHPGFPGLACGGEPAEETAVECRGAALDRRGKQYLRGKRFSGPVVLAAFAVASLLVRGQKPASPPEVLHIPAGTTEVGLLDGATYRIDVPADWNHRLVIYYHGYAQGATSFQIASRMNGQMQPLFDRHYAVAQSGYSQTGWALQQAYPETEQLRKYFTKAYGQPQETYATGASMGGALVMVTMELNAKAYIGGLDLCGAVGPTFESFNRRFAWRAAFDYYFPGVMPTLVPTPVDYQQSPALLVKILAALQSKPGAAAAMRALTGLHSDAEVAHDMSYFTYVIGDMQRRAGGNPFDNRNYLYTGSDPASSASDYALNDGVHRYGANPHAAEYLVRHYTPNGRLEKPMLALHTLYDPLINPRRCRSMRTRSRWPASGRTSCSST